jgi:hypothetical protein
MKLNTIRARVRDVEKKRKSGFLSAFSSPQPWVDQLCDVFKWQAPFDTPVEDRDLEYVELKKVYEITKETDRELALECKRSLAAYFETFRTNQTARVSVKREKHRSLFTPESIALDPVGALLNLADAARYKALTKLHKGSSNLSYRDVPDKIYGEHDFYSPQHKAPLIDKKIGIPPTSKTDGFFSAQSAHSYQDNWKKLYNDVQGHKPDADEEVDTVMEGALLNEAGNCGPLSSIAFFYCLIHSTDINVEIIEVKQDHMFVVLNRDTKTTDEAKWSTWNRDAVVCDPWLRAVFEAPRLGEVWEKCATMWSNRTFKMLRGQENTRPMLFSTPPDRFVTRVFVSAEQYLKLKGL